MPRKVRTPKARIDDISPVCLWYLSDGLLGVEPEAHNWEIFKLQGNTDREDRELWAKYREPILAEWKRQRPGKLPTLARRFDHATKTKAG